MYMTSRTYVSEALPDREEDLELRVEHDASDSVPYRITVGCVEGQWISEDDLIVLLKVLKKAQLVRKRAIT